MSEGSTPATVVWTGRYEGASPGGLDGWNTSPQDLLGILEGARELVVLDPLSFPWRNLPTSRRGVPLTVTLPRELDAEEIISVFERPLLRHLTAYDRLVEDRPDVRTELVDALGLPPEVWASAGTPPRETARDVQKARLYEAVTAVRADIRRRRAGTDDRPLVGFVGRAGVLAGLVASSVSAPYAVYPAEAAGPDETEPDGFPQPSPHIVVTWLDDGGQSSDERRALLGRSFDLLHPGGVLIVLAYVVTQRNQPDNPSISTLVDELSAASGGMIHVDELRSIRWDGESLARGVLLAATSLQVGRV